jgi:hypothetical protein
VSNILRCEQGLLFLNTGLEVIDVGQLQEELLPKIDRITCLLSLENTFHPDYANSL